MWNIGEAQAPPAWAIEAAQKAARYYLMLPQDVPQEGIAAGLATIIARCHEESTKDLLIVNCTIDVEATVAELRKVLEKMNNEQRLL